MYKLLSLIITVFFWTSISWGQSVSTSDSLVIMKKVDGFFKLIENPDFRHFKKISTKKIYCIICFEGTDFSDEPYMLDRKEFFNKHIKGVIQFEAIIRATTSQKIILVKESNNRSYITVFFTIYQKDELAKGHEGGQLGIYFRLENGEFKFAGLETIP